MDHTDSTCGAQQGSPQEAAQSNHSHQCKAYYYQHPSFGADSQNSRILSSRLKSSSRSFRIRCASIPRSWTGCKDVSARTHGIGH